MLSIWEVPYIVIDVETTGSDPVFNKVMDIACVVVYEGEIIHKYSSLVNPHQAIPSFIENMTGINWKMTQKAPEADEVFPHVSDLLSLPNAVFVAHNVTFDWRFVKFSLNSCGLSIPDIQQLCSLKIARKIINGDTKKNLSALSNYFDIRIQNRHRALGDAEATAKILIKLIDIVVNNHHINTLDEFLNLQQKSIKFYNPSIHARKRLKEKMDILPETPGVFYLKDNNGKIIYTNNEDNLKQGLEKLFSGRMLSKKMSGIIKSVSDLEWKVYSNRLEAEIECNSKYNNATLFNNSNSSRPVSYLNFNDKTRDLSLSQTPANGIITPYGPFPGTFFSQNLAKVLSDELDINTDFDDFRNSEIPLILNGHSLNNGLHLTDKINSLTSDYSDGIKELVLKRVNSLLEHIYSNKKPESYFLDLIVVTPENNREKTVEVIFIKGSNFAGSEIIGKKAPLDDLFTLVDSIYTNLRVNNTPEFRKTEIILDWIVRNREHIFLVIPSQYNTEETHQQLKQHIRYTAF